MSNLKDQQRPLNILILIKIVGALAFFIYGMKMMSEGIQRAASTQIRRIFRSVTSKSFIGVLIGFFTTSLVQSSSAVTVLIVSFVNAGLINLRQSVGLIMGSNIGTTITTWIIAYFGYNISMYSLSLYLFAFGVPLLFRNRNSKHWGEFLIGLGILIVSLSFLRLTIPEIDSSNPLYGTISQLSNAGVFSNILFVFIGMLLSLVTVSSSVAIALILTMCMKSYVSFELALFLVLGTNIGTCLTAEIAAWVGNTDAKRAARVHTLLNLFGAIYMVALMPIFISAVEYILSLFDEASPISDSSSVNYGLAIFHSLFNIFNVLVFFPFIDFLAKMANRSIPYDEHEKNIVKNSYINSAIRLPELSVLEIKTNIGRYSEIQSRMLEFNKEFFNTFDSKGKTAVYNRINKYYGISDKIYFEINDYLTMAFEQELSSGTNLILRTLYNTNRELNSLGTTYVDLANELERKRNSKIWVSPTQRQYINEYIVEVDKFAKLVESLLKKNEVPSKEVNDAYEFFEGLSTKKDSIIEIHTAMIASDTDNIKGAVVFENIIVLLFKISNHYKAILFQLSQTASR